MNDVDGDGGLGRGVFHTGDDGIDDLRHWSLLSLFNPTSQVKLLNGQLQ
jgi:hypothetical protein